MKSKEIRWIVLRTSWAQRLRLDLRTVLKLAVHTELKRLSDFKTFLASKETLTPSQEEKLGQLRKEWNTLYHKFNKSTLQCGLSAACLSFEELINQGFNPQDRPIPQDVVWVPWLEKWYCISCYTVNRFSEMTHRDFDDPVAREWVKNEFGI